mmetsp:Transcript_1829/g.2892  ORF Transcript_1829/g.2892 Transcript_1829/m.2892 type:complete len:1659 (+) Transcript_1829:173-5149(+)|eukprot:CAMPEP_0185021780 /NCGR_PEP_ID=MMETSP1103-20130426/4487_1 /TAXON_ID=36769 /ORGANISM="Paraphysomonas bandaiensis, Strain Caron Lab Isolate" /LENGTH=1658 /DNA_ID=CAMNT_0027553515 /DNA_START=91 /DNA_END=5067 /DNA_ORIENTATION=+
MGNNQPRYYNPREASEIIGVNTWKRLTTQLNKVCGRYIDYGIFNKILSAQFDCMPRALCECLYQAFAADIYSKVDVKDFISSLAAVSGHDRVALTKFLYRVYVYPGSHELDRKRIEKIIILAYGNGLNKEAAKSELNDLFSTSLTQYAISQRDFESYPGQLSVMSGWVQATLTIFAEVPPPRLASLERQYSAALESEQMMARYGVPKSTCDQLRQVFYSRCSDGGAGKAELSEDAWLSWTANSLPPSLALIIFRSKLDRPLKTVWRFVDFAEFCMVYGLSSDEDKASALCVALQQQSVSSREDPSVVSAEQLRRLVYILALPKAACDPGSPAHEAPLAAYVPSGHENLKSDLDAIEKETGLLLQRYVQLICAYADELPGLKMLAMTACCLFGLRPATPELEMEYITVLWSQEAADQTQRLPFGPVGTKWCVISSAWLSQWQKFVGEAGHEEPPPPMIDNWTILKKSTTTKQLLPGSLRGKDFEVIPPGVFSAVQSWYGGGPKIVRSVVSRLVSSQAIDTRPTLELFPPCLKFNFCDDNGKPKDNYTVEMLFSWTSTIAEITEELCRTRYLPDPSKIRLWNIDNKNWKKHYILSPELSIEKICLQDGQILLVECALSDGTWPKSQLHHQLELEESKKNGISGHDSSSSLASMGSSMREGSMVLNNGRVGLDNLGNTCYMNASLQALLHTSFLVEYFLTKRYLKDLNTTNKHGYEGRVALAFSKLVSDLWLSRQSDLGGALAAVTGAVSGAMGVGVSSPAGAGPYSVSPKRFRREIGALRDQFAGDDQHDAQELLSFLLDGLSEDLNLVHDKPYTEQPDSDDRPDVVLADIWWQNHLKRDFSVVQAIFTGQFKSITRCTRCTYNSARFEPFNMLSVPLPEDEMRSMVIHVVPRNVKESLGVFTCSVRVPKCGSFRNVVDAIREYSIPGISKDSVFLAVEIVQMKAFGLPSLDRKLDTVRDSDNIFFYQVLQLPTYKCNSLPRRSHMINNSSAATVSMDDSDNENGVGLCGDGYRVKRSANEGPNVTPREGKRSRAGSASEMESHHMQLPANDEDTEEYTSDEYSRPEKLAASLPLTKSVVEVVFMHRRLRCINNGGLELFKMDPVGLPLVEVLPSNITSTQLYEAVSERVGMYLKSPISQLAKSNMMSATVTSHKPANKCSFTVNEGIAADSLHRADSSLPDVISDRDVPHPRVRPVATEDAIGGDIPPHGFVLRLVTPNGDFCSRCLWLSRCEGCLIPYDDDESTIALCDGMRIAIDWHFVVYQEVLDLQPADVVTEHPSLKDHYTYQTRELPLDKCLKKFTEEEPLDDMVCPKCHDDGCLRRSFALWRLPPVLIIQLKRFQFNTYSRRKLTNQVDFPLEGLDMRPFLAPSAREMYSDTGQVTPEGYVYNNSKCGEMNGCGHDVVDSNKTISEDDVSGGSGTPGMSHNSSVVDLVIAEEEEERELLRASSLDTRVSSNVSEDIQVDSSSTSYDLYSAVYHVGALGGGHYISTVRDDNGHIQSVLGGSHMDSSGSPPPSPTIPLSQKWWCYNDSMVMPVSSSRDIVSPSAYVLFYMRRDLRTARVEDIYQVESSVTEGEMQDDVSVEGSSAVESLRIQASPNEMPTTSRRTADCNTSGQHVYTVERGTSREGEQPVRQLNRSDMAEDDLDSQAGAQCAVS